jgi:hypothetical protein
MSDLTIEILHNREKYPDDAEITLASGEKVTVGQWRNAVLPKGDFTKASEGWSKKERELTGQQAELQQTVIGLQAQLREAMQQKPPTPAAERRDGQYSEEDILADPVLGPIARRLQTAEAKANAAAERLEAHEKRMEGHEQTWQRAHYQAQLNSLGQRFNSRYNADGKGTPFDQKAFLDYAVERQVSNLDVAYDAFTREAELDLIRRESEARGEERGRKKAMVPAVPMGRRRGPVKPEGLPGSLQELTDEAIESDPEMIAAVRGEDE